MTAQFTTNTGSATRVPLDRVPARNSGVAAVGKALQMLYRVAPNTAGNIAETLFFSPRRLPLPIRYEHLLDEADSYTQIQLGAVTIPVYSWGYGPVVLMVHGWSSGGIQFGAFVQPLVSAGYRVVVFDAPGHGRAQGRRSSLYEMTEAVTKVAASVGAIDTIIAHSWAAWPRLVRWWMGCRPSGWCCWPRPGTLIQWSQVLVVSLGSHKPW